MLELAPGFDHRCTHYFSLAQVEALEILMLRLRTAHRLRAHKSELMRLALDRLLALPVEQVAELFAEATDAHA